MLKLRRIVGLIVLIGLVSTVASCPMGRYKYYSYSDAVQLTDFGLIRARLMGTYKKVSQDETILTSPYRLVVGVKIPLAQISSGKPCVLHIDEVTIKAHGAHEVVFSRLKISEPFVTLGGRSHSIAGWDRELLDIEYVDYDLAVTLSIAGCGSEVLARDFRLVINRDYAEGEETVWDFLRNL